MKSKRIMALLLTGAALMGITIGGCGNKIQDNAVFATLDDTTITMGVANFCAKYEQAMYDSIYMSYFGEDMWSSDMMGTGKTMTEDVKEGVAEQLQKMYLLKAHMEEYGVSLSEEEEAAITKAADDFIAANSKAAIQQIGAENKENVTEMLRLNTIQSKMRERIIQDANVEVTDEEAAQRTFSYVRIDTSSYLDEESNSVDYTEEEKAALKETADTIAKAQDFDTAVTDAGYTVSTASYGSAEDEDASLDKAVLEAADKLKEGQISSVIDTETACYVLRLDKEHDEEATASKKESLISQKEEDYYNDIVDGWVEKSSFEINESEWEKVVFEERFSRPEEAETETPSEGTESVDGGTESADQGTESVEEETEAVLNTETK